LKRHLPCQSCCEGLPPKASLNSQMEFGLVDASEGEASPKVGKANVGSLRLSLKAGLVTLLGTVLTVAGFSCISRTSVPADSSMTSLTSPMPDHSSMGGARRLTNYDPCHIKGPCYKGVVWFPGAEFMGPGWYCSNALDVRKDAYFDKCHIVSPCYFGAVWTGKRWECGVEDQKNVTKKYQDLMHILIHGPQRGDKIWAIKELDQELPLMPTSCPHRGWQAPKKCRMIGMDHGRLIMSVPQSTVLFDLLVCEDPEMRGRASKVLYNIVTDDKANLNRIIDKMGGLGVLLSHFDPETNTTSKNRGKALFGLNMLASECKAQSPDMCNFFSQMTQMNSSGLAKLVWHKPEGCGWELQVALQEAWVSSCTTKQGVPSKKDFEACGGGYLKNIHHGNTDQAYATLESLRSLLKQVSWKQQFHAELHGGVKPLLDIEELPDHVRAVASSLLSQHIGV